MHQESRSSADVLGGPAGSPSPIRPNPAAGADRDHQGDCFRPIQVIALASMISNTEEESCTNELVATITAYRADPLTGLKKDLPIFGFLVGPVWLWANEASSKRLQYGNNGFLLAGKFAYKGKGRNKIVDWQSSTIAAIEADGHQQYGRSGWSAKDLTLNGKQFLNLVKADRSGRALWDKITSGADQAFTFESPLNTGDGNDILISVNGDDDDLIAPLTGGPGADKFFVQFEGLQKRITDFNGLEGDRIKVTPPDKYKGSWESDGVVDFNRMEIYYSKNQAQIGLRRSDGDYYSGQIYLDMVQEFDPAWISAGTTPELIL